MRVSSRRVNPWQAVEARMGVTLVFRQPLATPGGGNGEAAGPQGPDALQGGARALHRGDAGNARGPWPGSGCSPRPAGPAAPSGVLMTSFRVPARRRSAASGLPSPHLVDGSHGDARFARDASASRRWPPARTPAPRGPGPRGETLFVRVPHAEEDRPSGGERACRPRRGPWRGPAPRWGPSPITSPVDFISGPRTGSSPRRRTKGKTLALAKTRSIWGGVRPRGPPVRAGPRCVSPGHDAGRQAGEGDPARLGEEGHRARDPAGSPRGRRARRG